MGYTGIGLRSATDINNLNPANFGLIPQNSFFYDIGITGEYNNFSNKGADETRTTFNFSNLAFAFRIAEGLGAGVTLIPYSDVGYALVGVRTNIEGTDETFESNVTGLGGLNDFRINLGYSITDRVRLGASTSFLFGTIEENESFQITDSDFQLTETTNYRGIRLGLGLQYDISGEFSFGSTIQFPTSLNGNLARSVLKTLDTQDVTVVDEEADTTSDFKMPLEFGLGISTRILNGVTFNVDYKRNYWENTKQSENIGEYVNQNIYAIGLEYIKDRTSYRIKDRIRYRLGFNYDDGYLAINDTQIDGYNITAGIGLPIGQSSNSVLNLSYGYGSKGQIRNILVQEDFHLLTLNMSLEDLWFRKRKIN